MDDEQLKDMEARIAADPDDDNHSIDNDDVLELITEVRRQKKIIEMMEPDHHLMCLRRGPVNDEYIKKLQEKHNEHN